MSPSEFVQSYSLPLAGMEQLVSLGLIEPCTEPIVRLLYPGLQLDRVSVLGFVDRLAEVLAPPLPDSVALEDIFHGIGGREKPCDLVWHWSVLSRLRSDLAVERWGETLSPVFYPGWRPPNVSSGCHWPLSLGSP